MGPYRRSIVMGGLAPLALGLSSCGSTNQQCDYVFFVPTNCVAPTLVASRSTTQLPAATKGAPNPVVATAPAPPVEAAAPAAAPPPAPAPAPPPALPELPDINVVYFETGQSTLSKGSKFSLGRIADYLKETKAETVQLIAYTDPIGSAKKNKELAEARARGVVEHLKSLGVDTTRLTELPYKLPKGSSVPPSEYWRLRKVALLFGPETMARVQTKEAAEELKAETDAQPDNPPHQATPTKVAAGADSSKDAPSDKPKLEKIDVIYWKSPNHGLFILAKKLGYFADEGFDVRLHESKLEANEISIKLADEVGMIRTAAPRSSMDVKNKHYFLGAVCPYGFHEALSKKLPFVEIGSMLSIANTMIMKKEMVDSIRKDLKSFRGTIGRLKNLPGDIDPIYFFVDRLRQAGLKEGVDFKYQYFDNPSAEFDALFRGEIAAGMSAPPWDMSLLSHHPDYGLLPLSALNISLPCCRQVVTRDNLKRNREKYVRFERAVIRAQRYLVEQPSESIEILAKFLAIPSSDIRAIMQRVGYTLSANPNVKGTVAFADTMKSRIGAGKVGDTREATDTSVYESALQSLIKEDPKSPLYHSMLDTYNRTK